jgi:hypothetical protein
MVARNNGIVFDRAAEGEIAESSSNYNFLNSMQKIGAVPSPDGTQR